MSSHYDNILIPIDASLDIERAVAKAMEFANPWGTTIHLVHLIRSWNIFKNIRESSYTTMLDENLEKYLNILIELVHWKNRIEKISPGITVVIRVKRDFALHPLIIHAARMERASLIILARKPVKRWLSMGTRISARLLAQNTRCDILSVKSFIKAGCTVEMETLLKPIFKSKNRPYDEPPGHTVITALPDLWSAN